MTVKVSISLNDKHFLMATIIAKGCDDLDNEAS